MYAGITFRFLTEEHGWFLGEKPGRFKLIEISGTILGIGIRAEISFF